MSTNHDAVAALPITGSADKSLVRNVLTKRMAYVLADVDDVTNLVAVDPATGAAILDILFLGRVFHYDSTDTTTANDGTSCLVSFEGRRYKLASSTDVIAYAVLDNTHSAPPASPAIGDAYLVAAAATGAWVGKSNFVAVFTRRGWEFVNFGIGRQIYVEAIDTYYHKNAAGSWIAGLGAQTLAAGSVPITAVLGAKASFVIKVENQTTNAPPASPVTPTAYVIGPAPTGAWAGLAGKLAICLVAGSFTIITPVAGDEVYDKALSVAFTFNGTAWATTAGGMLNAKIGSIGATVVSTTSGGSGLYTYSPATPPTTAQIYIEDSRSMSYTAKVSGNKLVFVYSFDVNSAPAGSVWALALFRDAEANAVDWRLWLATSNTLFGTAQFAISASDALAHTYKVRLINSFGGVGSVGATMIGRLFRVEEYAQ